MRSILDGKNTDHLDPNYIPPAVPTVHPSPDIGTGTAQPSETPASGPVQSAPAAAVGPAVSFDPPIASSPPAASPVSGVEAPAAEDDITKGKQEKPEQTKIILTGDRLRKYFPDVSMTPREIEESVYSALEERRQRQIKEKQKSSILKGKSR